VSPALVILYGVRVTRLVQFTTEGVERRDEDIYLYAGRAAITYHHRCTTCSPD
jgi:hypothetical protein